MKYYIILLLLVFIGLCLINYYFSKVDLLELFVNPDEMNKFNSDQANFFKNEVVSGIYVNPGLTNNDIDNLVDDAFKIVDISQEKSNGTNVSDYLVVDPLNPFREKDFLVCGGAKHPSNMSRAVGARYGCGWFFVPDGPGDYIGTSIGALGNVNGPVDRDVVRKNPTGKWIWNLSEAAKQEDLKICKRVKICQANVSGCGWCTSKGHSVPTNENGSLKYGNDSEGTCSETIYMKGSCPPPRKLSDSTVIIDSNGNNVGTTAARSEPQLCDPINGKLSRNCLKALAISRGCGINGSIVKLINSGSSPSQADKVAIDILARNNIVIVGNAELGNGDISIERALNVYETIAGLMKTGRTKQIRDAAQYLAVGGVEIDLCEVGGDSTGPFSPVCLSQAFREAGCQMSGSSAPKTSQDASGFTWNGIKTSYRELARNMTSTNSEVQKDAIQKCLGPNITTLPGRIEKCPN
jgi:hypothetical protein